MSHGKFRLDAQCEKCGSKQKLTPHHILPRRLGGSDRLYNIATLCWPCHQEFEKLLDKQQRAVTYRLFYEFTAGKTVGVVRRFWRWCW